MVPLATCSFHVTYHINIPYPQLHDSYSCLLTFSRAFPLLPRQPSMIDRSAWADPSIQVFFFSFLLHCSPCKQTHNNPLPPYEKSNFFFLDRSARLLLGQGCSSKIWLDDLEVGEERLGLVILHAGVHDNIIAYCTTLSLRNSKKGRKRKEIQTHQAPS